MQFSFGCMFLAIGVPLLVGGIMLMLRGRKRRVGDEPHCRACDYSLIGNESDACPECGAALTVVNVVHGTRRSRPGMFCSGVGMLLLSIVLFSPLGVRLIRDVNWYRLKPTFMVKWDLETKSGGRRALTELERRAAAGKLSATTREVLIEIGLKEQTKPAGTAMKSEWVNFLGAVCLRDEMSEEQKNLFLSQIMQLKLEVRPHVTIGNRAPVWVRRMGHTPRQNWWVSVRNEKTLLDGKIVQRGGGGSRSAGAVGGSSGTLIQCDKAGQLTAESHSKIKVYHGPFGDEKSSTLLYSETRKLSVQFDVVTDDQLGGVRMIDDPAMSQALRLCLQPIEFSFNAHGRNRLEGTIKMDQVPINVAFEVFAQYDGREVSLGPINKAKGGSTNYSVGPGPLKEPVPETINIVLRSSEQAARRTVDLFEIWDGEIVFEGVAVEGGKPDAKR